MEIAEKPGSRGGRPRKVSPEVALNIAEQVFWQRGLSGSTLDDLSTATGLPRPSLAATFGDKRALYLSALRQRANAIAAAVARMLDSDAPLPEVLEGLFAGALNHYLAGEISPQGCFLLSTALTPAREDPEVAEVLRASVASTERLIGERFERAGVPDAGIRAGLAASTLHYLAIRARAGDAPQVLHSHAQATAAWLAASPIDRSREPAGTRSGAVS